MGALRTRRSFFGRFKNRVAVGSGDPGGRYFAILLAELFQEMPAEIVHALFGKVNNLERFTQVSTEGYYNRNERRTKHQKRYADLIFQDPDGKTVGIVEIKEEDQLANGSDAQLSSYLKHIALSPYPVHFAYVTKHMPSPDCRAKLEANGRSPIFYGDLYTHLSSIDKQAVKLFCDYLREEGAVYEPIDFRNEDNKIALRLLVRQGLGFRNRGGGREVTAERLRRGPALLQQLLSNVEALGIAFHQLFGENLGNKFLPKFRYQPKLKIGSTESQQRRLLENLGGTERSSKNRGWLDRDDVDGGALYVYSEGRLTGPSTYIWLGYSFEIHGTKVSHYLDVGIYDSDYDEGKSFRTFPGLQDSVRDASLLIAKKIDEIAVKNPKCAGMPAMKDLRSAIRKKYGKT